jgi:acyl-CoA synthetase (AMP-forming)/AMP-acid ligase II
VFESGAEQCAAMIYTTGTTGDPKGVMLSHESILYVGDQTGKIRRVNRDDKVYCVLPVSHIFGLSSVLLGALAAGATIELAPKFSARALDQALRTRLTVFQGVPAMHARLLEYAEQHGITLSAPYLRYTSAGGSPLDPDLKRRVEAALGVYLHNGLGMTEAAPTIAVTRPGDNFDDISCGPLIPGTKARIVDPATKRRLALSEVGELWINGPGVMLGYYRNPQATAAVIDDEGWLNTGDLAHFDDNGSLWVDGRSKELIIRSGFNIYPPEVEAVINAHPDVVQSAVIGRDAGNGEEEVLAFVEVLPGSNPDPAEIIASAAKNLAPYKKPSELTILDRLPAGPTGKLLKHKLKI